MFRYTGCGLPLFQLNWKEIGGKVTFTEELGINKFKCYLRSWIYAIARTCFPQYCKLMFGKYLPTFSKMNLKSNTSSSSCFFHLRTCNPRLDLHVNEIDIDNKLGLTSYFISCPKGKRMVLMPLLMFTIWIFFLKTVRCPKR